MFETASGLEACELNLQDNKGPLSMDNTNEELIQPVIK